MKRPRRQEVRKRLDGACALCGEKDYAVLDAHRILPGEMGGTYHWANTITLCSNCHRRVHAGQVVIHERRRGSLGHSYLHLTIDGKEEWRRESLP